MILNKVTLVDFMNNVFISFAVFKKTLYEMKNIKGEEALFKREDIPFFIYFVFKKLNSYFSTYGKLIICFEGSNSLQWRRNIYADYKRNRDKSKLDDEYLVLKETFPLIENLLKFYPCKILKVDFAEADDLIYVLSERYHKENEVTIISTDGDMAQIINKFDNVSVYNPIRSKYMDKRPDVLLEKAIVGDVSDGIPGIPGIGKKTFVRMMEDKSFFVKKMQGENKEIIKKFLSIIDLSKMPEKIKKNILDKETETSYNNFEPDSIEQLFFTYKMKDALEHWGNVSGDIAIASKKKELI